MRRRLELIERPAAKSARIKGRRLREIAVQVRRCERPNISPKNEVSPIRAVVFISRDGACLAATKRALSNSARIKLDAHSTCSRVVRSIDNSRRFCESLTCDNSAQCYVLGGDGACGNREKAAISAIFSVTWRQAARRWPKATSAARASHAASRAARASRASSRACNDAGEELLSPSARGDSNCARSAARQ